MPKKNKLGKQLELWSNLINRSATMSVQQEKQQSVTHVKERDAMPTAREIASDEMVAQARARGEMHGFTGIFLDHFIELELQMQRMWNNRKKGGISCQKFPSLSR